MTIQLPDAVQPATDLSALRLEAVGSSAVEAMVGHRAVLAVRLTEAGAGVPCVGIDVRQLGGPPAAFEGARDLAPFTNLDGEAAVAAVVGDGPSAFRVSVRGAPELFLDFQVRSYAAVPGPASAARPLAGLDTPIEVRFAIEVNGRDLADVVEDLDVRPLQVSFAGSHVDLRDDVSLEIADPDAVAITVHPTASSAEVWCRVQSGQQTTSASVKLTKVAAWTPATRLVGVDDSVWPVVRHTETVNLQLINAYSLPPATVPGTSSPQGFSLRIEDDAGNTYALTSTRAHRSLWTVRVKWTCTGGTLTTDRAVVQGHRSLTVEATEHVYAIPDGWAPMRVEVRTLDAVPDPSPRIFQWVEGRHSGSATPVNKTEVQDRLTATLRRAWTIRPPQVGVQLLDGDDWVDADRIPEVGDQVRVWCEDQGGPLAGPAPEVELRGVDERGLSTSAYDSTADAVARVAMRVDGVTRLRRRTWVSDPVTLAAHTTEPMTGRSLRVGFGGAIELPDGRRVRVARRRAEPVRLPLPDGSFRLPLDPHGRAVRAGSSGSLLLAQRETETSAVDLVRRVHGTEVSVQRHWRSGVLRSGTAGPGWGFEHERHATRLPGNLIRLVDVLGEEHVFVLGGPPQPGRHLQVTVNADHEIVVVDGDGNLDRYAWDGSLARTETHGGRVTRHDRNAFGAVQTITVEDGDPTLEKVWRLDYHPYDPAHAELFRHLRRVVDDLGREVLYEYEALGTPVAGPVPADAPVRARSDASLEWITLPDPGYRGQPRPRYLLVYTPELLLAGTFGPENPPVTPLLALKYDAALLPEHELYRGVTTEVSWGGTSDPHDVIVTEANQVQTALRFVHSPFADAGAVHTEVRGGGLAPDEPAEYWRTFETSRDGHLTRAAEWEPSDPQAGRITTWLYDWQHGDPRARGNLLVVARFDEHGGVAMTDPVYESLLEPDSLGRPTRYTPPLGHVAAAADERCSTTVIWHGTSRLPARITTPAADHEAWRRPRQHDGHMGSNAWFDEPTYLLYEYGQDDRLERYVDEDGFATTYGYDANGYLARVTIDADRLDGRRVHVFDGPEGKHEAIVRADALGEVQSLELADGTKLTWTHDALGRLWEVSEHKAGAGRRRRFERDAQGRVNKIYEQIDGQAERVIQKVSAFTPFGLPLTEEILEGKDRWRVVERSYDQLGRITSETQRGATTTIAYNSLGRIWRHTDLATSATPQVTRYTHDAHGDLLQVHTALGTTDHVYASNGDLRAVVDPVGNTTIVRWNAGHTHRITELYDGMNGRNPNRRPNAPAMTLQARTAEEIDRLGRVVRVYTWKNVDAHRFDELAHDPHHTGLFDGHTPNDREVVVTRMDWTRRGMLSTLTGHDGYQSNITYDALGRQDRVDVRGREATDQPLVWRRNVTATALEERTVLPSGEVLRAVAAAAGGAAAAAGELVRIESAESRIVLDATSTGAELTIERPGGDRVTLELRHADEIAARANDARLSLKFDSEGRLEELIRDLTVWLVKYSYETGQRSPHEVQYDDGSKEVFAYNGAGLPSRQLHRSGVDRSFTYHPDGTLASLTHAYVPDNGGNSSFRFDYQYDARGRVTQADVTFTGPGGSHSALESPRFVPPRPLVMDFATDPKPFPVPTLTTDVGDLWAAIGRAGGTRPVITDEEHLAAARAAAEQEWGTLGTWAQLFFEAVHGLGSVLTFGATDSVREWIYGEDAGGVVYPVAYEIGVAAGVAFQILMGNPSTVAGWLATAARAYLLAQVVHSVGGSVYRLATDEGGMVDVANILATILVVGLHFALRQPGLTYRSRIVDTWAIQAASDRAALAEAVEAGIKIPAGREMVIRGGGVKGYTHFQRKAAFDFIHNPAHDYHEHPGSKLIGYSIATGRARPVPVKEIPGTDGQRSLGVASWSATSDRPSGEVLIAMAEPEHQSRVRVLQTIAHEVAHVLDRDLRTARYTANQYPFEFMAEYTARQAVLGRAGALSVKQWVEARYIGSWPTNFDYRGLYHPNMRLLLPP